MDPAENGEGEHGDPSGKGGEVEKDSSFAF